MRPGISGYRATLAMALATAIATSTAVRADTTQDLEDAGDIIQILLPAAAGVATLFEPTTEGTWMWAASTSTMIVTTSGIKFTVEKTRPTGASQSFPSGHTAAAFSGASFIQRRYGWGWGVPAYGLAGFVGWTRVNADKHDWADVLSGATIGVASTYIFTTPFEVAEMQATLSPWFPVSGDEDYYGLRLNLGVVTAGMQDDAGETQVPLDDRPDDQVSDAVRNFDRNTQVWTGTDPTDITSNFDVNFAMLDQRGVGNRNTSNFTGYIVEAGYHHAIAEKHLIGGAIRYVWNEADPFSGDGFGDIELNWTWAPYKNMEANWYAPRAMAFGVDLNIPTGEYVKGTSAGAWVARPRATFAFTPIQNFNVYATLSYYHSWDEDVPAAETRVIAIEPKVEYKFTNGVYLSWAPEFIIDTTGREEDTANHFFELGFPLADNTASLYFEYSLIGRDILLPGNNPTGPNNPRFYDDVVTIGLRTRF